MAGQIKCIKLGFKMWFSEFLDFQNVSIVFVEKDFVFRKNETSDKEQNQEKRRNDRNIN